MKYIFCGRLNTINQHRCVTHFCAGNAIQLICELLPAVERAAKRITLDAAKKLSVCVQPVYQKRTVGTVTKAQTP